MRKTIEIIFICILLSLSFVAASSPNNQVTQLFDTDVVNGINGIGEILVIPMQYEADEFTVDNFSDIQVERYDRFIWIGNNTISFITPSGTDDIVVPGSSYIFMQQGIYTYAKLTNITMNATVTALAAPINRVQIEVLDAPNGIELQFFEDDFILTNEKVIEAILDVNEDVDPGQYTVLYQVGEVLKNYTFVVEENKAWKAKENFTLQQDIKAGESRYIGYIEINNTGNTDVELDILKIGNNTDIVVVPDKRTLFKKSSIRFDVQLQVPSTTEPGSYEVELYITDDDNDKNITLTIDVVDSEKPKIERINFSEEYVFMDNIVSVIATDNNEVTNVTIDFDGKNFTMEKDQNLFTFKHSFKKLSQYTFDVCAYDASDNVFCKQVNKTFDKMNVIEGVEKNIRLPTVKFSSYSSAYLLTLNESMEDGVVVELVSIESEVAEDDSYSVRIVDDEGGAKRFDIYENEIKLYNAGDYYIEVRSEEMRQYEGVLRVHVPEYVTEVADINFEVAFKDYSVPLNYTIPDIYGKQVDCNPVDTGDYDTSYQECTYQIPFSVNSEDIVVPLSVNEKNRIESSVDEVQQELEEAKRRSAVIISLLVVFFISILMFIYYIVYTYPYQRIKVKIKDDD